MKKLMMMVAVCALAGAAQAFAVNWSCSNVRIPLADNPKVSQTGIKVTTGSTAFDANALTLHIFWQDKNDSSKLYEIGTGWKNNSGANLTATPIIQTGDATYQAITYAGDPSSGTPAQWGTNEKPNFVVTASYATADGVYEFSGTYQPAKAIGNLNSGNITMMTSMTNGTWNYTASAVPEPTSGLLLLLGVAGLALRRRRA